MAAEPLDLHDRVCLIMGAGRGIGLATARELARRGARGIVLVDGGVTQAFDDYVASRLDLPATVRIAESGAAEPSSSDPAASAPA